MASFIPHTAMLLAAGMGTRMLPLTLDRPKPMLHVAGKPMIDHALDKLVAIGVKRAVINLHYKGEAIENHLRNRRDIEIIFIHEEELLETGGGVKNALPNLGDAPFFCINTDLIFTDAPLESSLLGMATTWDSDKMDCLLLVKETTQTVGFDHAKGDYFLDPITPQLGRLHSRKAAPPRPYVFIGTQIVKPQAYAPVADKHFSNLKIFDQADAAGRLYGYIHQGGAYHAGTPEDLAHVNGLLAAG
jgi:N-acetyl-alpha-D-muramate 1-phosphate uridylyltransferase